MSQALAVVRIGDSWVLLHSGRRWGRFARHENALRAAERLSWTASARGVALKLLDQEVWGEIVPLTPRANA